MTGINFTANKSAYVKPIAESLIKKGASYVNEGTNLGMDSTKVAQITKEVAELRRDALLQNQSYGFYDRALINVEKPKKTTHPYLGQTEPVNVESEGQKVNYFSPSTPSGI